MLNFYHQVGYSGMFILLLGLVAIFMAIRGVVLVILIKSQAPQPNSIVQQIVSTTREKTVKSDDENGSLKPQNPKNQVGEAAVNVSKELIVNTLMQVQMKGVYSSLYYLKLCAAIGPLLGLLGTVLGMVDVFSTLSSRSMPDPSLLAGGIWEALLTTVMGLTLAIPALIVHYYLLMNLRHLRNRINLQLCQIELN